MVEIIPCCDPKNPSLTANMPQLAGWRFIHNALNIFRHCKKGWSRSGHGWSGAVDSKTVSARWNAERRTDRDWTSPTIIFERCDRCASPMCERRDITPTLSRFSKKTDKFLDLWAKVWVACYPRLSHMSIYLNKRHAWLPTRASMGVEFISLAHIQRAVCSVLRISSWSAFHRTFVWIIYKYILYPLDSNTSNSDSTST